MQAIVIGCDGAIGGALLGALAARGDEAIGTSRRAERSAATVKLDLSDPAAIETRLPPAEVAFFCAGIAGFAACRAQPALAVRVNATAPTALAARLVARGTRVVLLSTSAVLAPPPADSVYGRSKAEAERHFLSHGRACAVLRMSKVLAPSSALFQRWIGALVRGERIIAFDDLRFSPLSLDQVVAALLAIADRRGDGLFQASGADSISYFEAARHVARRLGVGAELVGAGAGTDHGLCAEDLAAGGALDTRRLADFCGFAPLQAPAVIDAVFGRAIGAARRSA